MNIPHHRVSTLGKSLSLTAFMSFAVLAHSWGHAFIDHTDPPVGGAVKQAPAEVRLWYTQGLEPAFSRMQVFDAAGKEVDKQDVHLDPKNNHLIIVSLAGKLGAGVYKVVWRMVSVDTHTTEGSFKFRVEP